MSEANKKTFTDKFKKSTTKLKSNKNFRPFALFAGIFAFVGVAMLLRSFAATPTAQFEAEAAALTNASSVSDANASGGAAVQFGTATSTSFPIHPGVVYSKTEIDSWSTSSPEYTRLKGDNYASLAKAPILFGSRIDGPYTDAASELNAGLKDQSGAAKTQAVLWATDNDINRKNKVIAYLDGYKDVRDFEWDKVEQYRLVAGWGCTNLAQAAEIVDYQDAGFKTFLRKCYDEMDWTSNPNWHASFADSKLAIAAYLGDSALWTDAMAYFYERIEQHIYHSSYDGNKVNPHHKADRKVDVWQTNPDGSFVLVANPTTGVLEKVKIDTLVPYRLHSTPGTTTISSPDLGFNMGSTRQSWGGPYDSAGKGQINDDFTINTKYGAVDGMNSERLRDLGHVNMGLGAFMHGLRTLKAQGQETTPQYLEAYARLLAAYDYHSKRVNDYIDGIPLSQLTPAPVEGDGGGSRFQAYYGAKKLFGTQTPQSVLNILNETTVTSYDAGGYNHLTAEAFADQ